MQNRKFVVNGGSFKKAIKALSHIVKVKSTIPQHNHISFKLDNGVLSLRATYDFTEATYNMPTVSLVPCDKTLDILIIGKQLISIASKIPVGADVLFEFEEGAEYVDMTLSYNSKKFTLHAYRCKESSDEKAPMVVAKYEQSFRYDAKYKPKKLASFTVPVHEFMGMVKRLSPSISNDVTRYYLNGIYMNQRANYPVEFVSTNGHVLNKQIWRDIIPVPKEENAAFSVIMRSEGLEYLKFANLKEYQDEPMTLDVFEDYTIYTVASYSLKIRNIDGSFPDYNRVIPEESCEYFTANPKELQTALKDMISYYDNNVTIKMIREESSLGLSAYSQDLFLEDSLYSETKGGHFEIGFNASFLVNLMKDSWAGVNKVSFDVAHAGSPTLITSETNEDFLSVIMPARI